ncbi:MAG TPA: hypothetical protein VGH09_02715 [Solirubrobacteraceae bacterium]
MGNVVNRGALTVAGMIVGELRDESGRAQIEPGVLDDRQSFRQT